MREAIVTLDDAELEALGFGDLVSQCRAVGVRDVEMLESEGATCVPQVVVEDRLDGAVLADLECVDGWELVDESGDTYRYVLELTATELPDSAAEDYEGIVGTCDPSVTSRGILLSFVGSQEAIREWLRNYEATGAAPDLRKLAEYDGGEDPLDALTDRQREVVETAYELGFYEVPREATTEDVAAELDVDPATVSEHLQRAERNLIARHLPA